MLPDNFVDSAGWHLSPFRELSTLRPFVIEHPQFSIESTPGIVITYNTLIHFVELFFFMRINSYLLLTANKLNL